MDAQRVDELCGAMGQLVLELRDATGIAVAAEETDRRGPSAARLRAALRARRSRAAYFDGSLFADPAWDMMLDLLAAQQEQRSVCVSSLCLASGVPQTTALRWIGLLVARGVFVRRADARDGRRVFLALSDDAAARLRVCLANMEALGPI